jgi:hypothetical protein
MTFIVREGRINVDRAATISDLQDFILENASFFNEHDVLSVLADISLRMLKSNDETIEVNQLKLENVFGMTERVKNEVCILEAKLDE